MNLNAEYERKRAEQIARIKSEDTDDAERRRSISAQYFHEQSGLRQAIETEIFPCLVRLKSLRVSGIGYYQFSNWLVSNAHLAPRKETLDNLQIFPLFGANTDGVRLEYKKSYHRPYNATSPDIVIINTRSENPKGISPKFLNDESSYYNRSHFFYVDMDTFTGKVNIRFLRPASKPGEIPLHYECVDESVAQPGSSGSPIIEARVVISRNPSWQFSTVGVLFGRCENSDNEPTKHICAIPTLPDLEQLLQVLNHKQFGSRSSQLAKLSAIFGDNQGQSETHQHKEQSLTAYQTAQSSLTAFEDGVTELNILLPPNLEPLWYGDIVKLSQSLLITKVRKNELGGNFGRFPKVPNVDPEYLLADFTKLLADIATYESVKPVFGNHFLDSEHLRVDVKSGGDSNQFWILEIQDNTGKVDLNGKSLSSIFARVHLKKSDSTIPGNKLSELFSKSQNDLNTHIYTPEIAEIKTSKKGNKAAYLKIQYQQAAKEANNFYDDPDNNKEFAP